ncbi:MAG: hypothetical protein ACRBB6_05250 [Neptuniibacter sp.]
MLALVRDLKGTRVVYYWINKARLERVSPIFPSFPIAEEWILKHLHNSYKGKDRRRSPIDRRKLKGKSDNIDKRTFSNKKRGRRVSDKRPQVIIDMAKVKLDELKLLYTEDLIKESDIDREIVFEPASEPEQPEDK